jgi:hypothetical protein
VPATTDPEVEADAMCTTSNRGALGIARVLEGTVFVVVLAVAEADVEAGDEDNDDGEEEKEKEAFPCSISSW